MSAADESSLEGDQEEPKFDYDVISRENDLAIITKRDTITCACPHDKFFALGTQLGRIHIFDHEGIKMDRRDLCPHLKSVNCISIDEKGEYLVSCSNEKLVVYGLCNSDHNFVLMTDKPTNVVAIDPYFHRTGNGRKFVAGDDRVTLYERGFLTRYKSSILQSKEQKVRSISWHGQFIAWATDTAVQIFDVEQRSVITRIKRDLQPEIEKNLDQCQFCWRDKRTLLIGWSNTIKVCVIKERSHEVLHDSQLQRELPKKYVEIVSMFETDFVICGLAPFDKNLFVLSMHSIPQALDESTASSTAPPELATTTTTIKEDNISINSSIQSEQQSTSRREQPVYNVITPQVHLLETFSNSYKQLSLETPDCDGILAKEHGRDTFRKFSYSLQSYHENGTYLIVSPKQVIAAKPRDYDDHIDWLIQHNMLRECCHFARKHAKALYRHKVKQVEELYMNRLLTENNSESWIEGAKLCASICDTDQECWDANIRKFCQLKQLKHLLPHLPKRVDGFHLTQESYDMILDEFLKNDSVSFFKAIKEIPCLLYSVQTMADNVMKNLANDPKNLVLNEALAELYTRMGKFRDAVEIYLDYNDATRIFSLIRNNNLVSILRDRVDRLMQIDADETSQLLVENLESIPMRDVVERLEQYKSKQYLVSYLHRLALKDPDSCIEYHDLMVKLYAQYQRDSLLNFLKLSTNYRLEEALRICKEFNLIKEVVYLLGRMGDSRVALRYITEQQGDIEEAIEFCKEHQDPELWQDLILYSLDKPDFIGALLKSIGAHINDPIELIDRIPDGCEIEGLMPALVKILQDYQLQISLERSYQELMSKDCFTLLEKQIRCQTQGISIRDDQLCDHCNQPLITEAMMDTLSELKLSRSPEVTPRPRALSQSGAAACLNDLVVFGCHHVFHEECCSNSVSANSGSESPNKILTCRVCMLERDSDSVRGY